MLHTFAHYGSNVAFAFSGICVVFLLILLATTLDTPRREWKNLVWEVPATCTGLGVFWTLVALGLRAL